MSVCLSLCACEDVRVCVCVWVWVLVCGLCVGVCVWVYVCVSRVSIMFAGIHALFISNILNVDVVPCLKFS